MRMTVVVVVPMHTWLRAGGGGVGGADDACVQCTHLIASARMVGLSDFGSPLGSIKAASSANLWAGGLGFLCCSAMMWALDANPLVPGAAAVLSCAAGGQHATKSATTALFLLPTSH